MKSITILTLALALAACARHDAPTPIATAVELAPVREETRGSATRYSATVEPDTQVAVAFRVSGYVDARTSYGSGDDAGPPAAGAIGPGPHWLA